MIILDVQISNLYVFDNFHIDFILEKENKKNTFLKIPRLNFAPKIKYKDVNIIMGANASGKTLFGRLLCYFQNLIIGRNGIHLINPTDLSKKSKFKVIFNIDTHIFEYAITAKSDGQNTQVYEELKMIQLNEKLTWKKVLKNLENAKAITSSIDEVKDVFTSAVIKEKNKKFLMTYQQLFDISTSFYYRSDNYKMAIRNEQSKFEDDLFKFMEKLLMSIDTNILGIRRVESSTVEHTDKKMENSFYIQVKNRADILVENVQKLGEIRGLSQGTIESIYIAHLLSFIDKINGVIYLDEQMAYMHSQLSNSLIVNLITRKHPKSQLFITTHNESILDLKIPVSSYVFFKKENDCVITVHPEKRPYGRITDFKHYVQNDYFGTYPNLDTIWEMSELNNE